ncbi:MAG TPA: efflux RND transporter periplasmic adaptor subunit [Prosthecobacter sp.]|nr:efflux RND transporter periplasmic adaptor subunit [Prosthecobacter sp.]
MMKLKAWHLVVGAAVIAVAAWFMLRGPGGAADDNVPTFAVQKGPLQINVLQGGEIRALRNFEHKSEIETPTKIISVIPEGYLVTEEDVKEGKVLIELDSTDLRTRIQDHEIQFQTTVSMYIDADEGREIQRSENQSLVRDMKQTAGFALMDFEKYLGRQLAADILVAAGLPKDIEAFDRFADDLEQQANVQLEAGAALKVAQQVKETPGPAVEPQNTDAVPLHADRMDFSPYLERQDSGDGEAQQKLRQLEDELLLRKSELAVAKQKVEASQRLAAREFISRTQLENDQVNFEKVSLSVKTAETQLSLFKTYEFSKQCALLLSEYRESLTKLQRTVRANRSKMAQAETRFQTAKRRYDMELAKKDDLDRQLKACLIRASQPGLVAYGNLNASSSTRYSEPIEEGATIRFRQTLLTIPDMSQMGVSVNIHESQVKKVRIGQPALIRVDAEPGKVLEGRVAELALMPDSGSSRYTPNLKVYPASVHIFGTHTWMKPGMNAKVEVIVDQLADVMFVPVQSIEVQDDKHYCYVTEGSGIARRSVVTGLFNDEFIEVREGLAFGEKVALSIPKSLTSEPKPATGPAQQPSGAPQERKPKETPKARDVAAVRG